jgi:hypothetical protein
MALVAHDKKFAAAADGAPSLKVKLVNTVTPLYDAHLLVHTPAVRSECSDNMRLTIYI